MLHLETLTPKTDIEGDFKPLYHELKNCLDQDSVNNIGIIGPYGSGKSSFTESFLTWIQRKENSKRIKNKINGKSILRLSLVHITSEKSQKLQNPVTCDDFKNVVDFKKNQNKELEECILKQIMYSTESKKLEESGMVKIPNNKKYLIIFMFFVFLIASIVLSNFLVEFKNYNTESIENTVTEIVEEQNITTVTKLMQLQLDGLDNSILKVLCILDVFFVFVCFIFFFFSIKKIFKNPVKKLKLYSNEIEFENPDEKTPFNTYIAEILYFFMKTKKNIVLIEDIDRFNNDEIFLHLKELNFIINNYPGLKRKVKFFYLINDSVFPKEGKTKFFEMIIPIIPVTTNVNMGDKLINHRNGLDKNDELCNYGKPINEILTDEYLIKIGTYISDCRMMIHIWNEFKIYCHLLKENPFMNIEKLFSFVVVKNMLPDINDKILSDNQFFNNILSLKKEFLRKKIEEENALINTIESNPLTNYDTDVEKLSRNFLTRYFKENNKETEEAIVKKFIDDFKMTYTEFIQICRSRNSVKPEVCKYVKMYDFNRLRDENGETYTQKRDSIEDFFRVTLHSNESRLKKNKEKLNSLLFMTFSDIFTNYPNEFKEFLFKCHFEDSTKTVALKIIDLLCNGIIDENYLVSSNIYYEGYISAWDQKYVSGVKLNYQFSPDYPIDNPIHVLNKLSVDYQILLKQRNCNYYILNSLIYVYENPEYTNVYSHYKSLFSSKKLGNMFDWYLSKLGRNAFDDAVFLLSRFDPNFLDKWFDGLSEEKQDLFIRNIISSKEFITLDNEPPAIHARLNLVLSNWSNWKKDFTEEEIKRVKERYLLRG